MKKIVLALCLVTILVFACTDRDDELTLASIRIFNNSNLNFNLVEVIADSLFYENVPADGFSEYLSYDEAFEAMPFSISTDSADFNFTPDELELDLLPIGLYTYEITISDEGEIVLNFKID
ncbi:hypothetical protein [Croceitalea rosinachiae]|uniref:DUF4625 domain-containing protein n=1 Tax=Croceitalea rosinachiae TaxID=3075596 RepID=A0ABU3AFP6_9FLAO|nr:hypothetical protein [Croceitalea sp. F388]MDT0608387.1 hypothetical protein [Croceitalea sp. F388]